ncbi:MAG: DSD1 family PLP-dependent enzyme [Acidobacteria bacterium]|nr:DSD1 family PLP-dependent enzyme [Acidobacteriota bacterium]MSO61356.1 DSD1 family PLP-dependent enzyme [Acidobacteriota bacterium]
MQFRGDIPTPALLLDLDAFESNITAMAAHLLVRGKAFRPHGKTHKCPEVARALINAGAIGCCAARLAEAEVFADHGIPGLLITTAVIGRDKIARAVALAKRAPDTIYCVDDPDNVRELNAAAARAGVNVRVAIDLYFGRTGVLPGPPALALARNIASLAHLTLVGLQSYDGDAAHTTPFEARWARTDGSMAKAIETRALIERDGIPCPMVTGGSTGTYRFDAENPGMTELQPGSFVFMDLDYGRIGGPDGREYRDFKNALTVVTTVVSRPHGFAIVDGGYKAFSTDRPFTPKPVDLPGVTYGWAGDEHGRLNLTDSPREVKVGHRIEFIPPHCDPTVNLYDHLYALRGDRVEGVWPIAARGKSQ